MIGLLVFLALSCMSCLYILEINPLSIVSFAIIFSHSEGCPLTLLIVSFAVQKLLKFNLVYFCFYFHYSRRWVTEKAMAPHSNTLAWKIPWMEKPAVHGVAKSQT